jgi:hypothetical protein
MGINKTGGQAHQVSTQAHQVSTQAQQVSTQAQQAATGRALALRVITPQDYDALVDELKGIVTEGVHASRWLLIKTYHKLGATILMNEASLKPQYGEKYIERLAKSTEINKRDLYYALAFAKKYPSLDKVPDGKNASWSKLVKNYLAEKKKEKELPVKCTCPKCQTVHDVKEMSKR